MATSPTHLPPGVPPYVKVFGPGANCTLEICPVEMSVYGYRPSLAVNSTFLALYVLSAAVHLYLGIRWKTWFFMGAMLLGATSAVLGYAGRIVMYYNPFKFVAFMIQIICVTSVPVYYTAAIYVTLAASIKYFAPSLSRFRPNLIYWVFISSDLVCLVLQAAGGALSTSTAGASQTGVDMALVGLSLQVLCMVVFCALFGDYLYRYFRSDIYRFGAAKLGARPKLFFAFLALAIVLILARCAYRLAELHNGYRGGLIRDEGLFIGLEGVMVICAVFCLTIGHPGFVFKSKPKESTSSSELENLKH
ncbi:hypothetical protein JX265_005659 [Neoarthrinium moseri]|uniref:Sphingoid long-chain base transporter RSB1 n=1 Tax=Neoarthrinium moseri TaxID=1658444 RepID=A0A9P9WNG6_9PEZI|nr:hypothetical protein JX265_005659 [Neoarthrinium moseri]